MTPVDISSVFFVTMVKDFSTTEVFLFDSFSEFKNKSIK